tara:strand:+ start:3300 stop:4577 length:1278 start_codon:yes stop_codon:yes gene_type:complete
MQFWDYLFHRPTGPAAILSCDTRVWGDQAPRCPKALATAQAVAKLSHHGRITLTFFSAYLEKHSRKGAGMGGVSALALLDNWRRAQAGSSIRSLPVVVCFPGVKTDVVGCNAHYEVSERRNPAQHYSHVWSTRVFILAGLLAHGIDVLMTDLDTVLSPRAWEVLEQFPQPIAACNEWLDVVKNVYDPIAREWRTRRLQLQQTRFTSASVAQRIGVVRFNDAPSTPYIQVANMGLARFRSSLVNGTFLRDWMVELHKDAHDQRSLNRALVRHPSLHVLLPIAQFARNAPMLVRDTTGHCAPGLINILPVCANASLPVPDTVALHHRETLAKAIFHAADYPEFLHNQFNPWPSPQLSKGRRLQETTDTSNASNALNSVNVPNGTKETCGYLNDAHRILFKLAMPRLGRRVGTHLDVLLSAAKDSLKC